jgi:hypothetical protein
MIVMATAGVSQGKNFVQSEFRFIAAVAAAQATPYVMTATYIAKFGSIPAAGNKVFVRAFNVVLASGLQSAYLQTSVTL